MYLRCGKHVVGVTELTFRNGVLYTDKDDLYDLGFKIGDVVEIVEGQCPDVKAERRRAMILWIDENSGQTLDEMAKAFSVSRGAVIVELFMNLTDSDLALFKSGKISVGVAYLRAKL